MLALIKREIEDNIVFFIIAAIIAIVFTVILIYSVMTYEMEKIPIEIPISMYTIFLFILLGLNLINLLMKPYGKLYDFNNNWSVSNLQKLCKEASLTLPKPSDI